MPMPEEYKLKLDVPLFAQRDPLKHLTYIEEHAREWCNNFEHFHNKAAENAQCREVEGRRGGDPHRLNRGEMYISKRLRERRLEQSLWRNFKNCTPATPFLPGVATRIVTYQFPLQNVMRDNGQGEIDLLAVSPCNLPVVMELKSEDGDTPLWMIAEAYSYALSLKKTWEHKSGSLITHWKDKVDGENLPKYLYSIPLLCIAPHQYWERREGIANNNDDKLTESAWREIDNLRSKLESIGYPVYFIEFDVNKAADDVDDFNGMTSKPRLRKVPH